MKQYIVRRIGYCLLSLFLLSLTIFFFVRVTGDPAALLVEPGASPDDIAAIHHQFGLGTPLHLIMPAFALGWYFAASHMRLTRSSMLEVLGSEYVKLARLKGLPQALVIAKHAFKNALIPVLTLAGINFVIMISVAVVVETVFAWPGVGRLPYEGIAFRDFPVVQGTVMMLGAMTVIVNLVVDVLYAVIARSIHVV